MIESSDYGEARRVTPPEDQLENNSAPDKPMSSHRITQNAEELADQLRDKVIHTDHGTIFLPLDALDVLLAREDNLAALKQFTSANGMEDNNISFSAVQSFVCKSMASSCCSPAIARAPGSKILAVLLLIGKPEMISRFILEDLTDEDLPFQFTRNGSWVIERRQGQPIEQAFSGWSYPDIVNFKTQQWTVLPPFFWKPNDIDGGHVCHHNLQKESILPFEESGEGGLHTSSGNYGTVFKVKIHPAHCNFDSSDNSGLYFGVKRLKDKDREAFNKEVNTLERFSINTNKHLIQLLATYKYQNSYYLIFPWADNNLQGLWESIRTPQHTPKLALWMARQCHGLALGLSNIHVWQQSEGLLPQEKPFGRHNDIKHENVLWFKDNSEGAEEYDGELKISDFGLVKFNSESSRYIIPKDNLFTPTYMPPECALPNHVISRSLDLWSLGCLYLEFVTWLLKGYTAAIESFTDNRLVEGSNSDETEFSDDNFFAMAENMVSLKSSVIECMKDLHSDPQCTAYLHDFLDCIANHLLVPNPAERIRCVKLVEKLEEILQRCDRDQEYCTKGEPRSNHPIIPKDYILGSSKVATTPARVAEVTRAQRRLSSGDPTPVTLPCGTAENRGTQQTGSEVDVASSLNRAFEEVNVPNSGYDTAATSDTLQSGLVENTDAMGNETGQGRNGLPPHIRNGNRTVNATGEGQRSDVCESPADTVSKPRWFWERLSFPLNWGMLCIGRRRVTSDVTG